MKADERAMLRIGLGLFGAGQLAMLFGWCALLMATAPADADRAWVLAHGPRSLATRYRRVGELERLRAALIEAGYELDELTDGSRFGAALEVVAA